MQHFQGTLCSLALLLPITLVVLLGCQVLELAMSNLVDTWHGVHGARRGRGVHLTRQWQTHTGANSLASHAHTHARVPVDLYRRLDEADPCTSMKVGTHGSQTSQHCSCMCMCMWLVRPTEVHANAGHGYALILLLRISRGTILQACCSAVKLLNPALPLAQPA